MILTSVFAKELPKLLTKQSIDSIRFMSADGRFTYLQKKPGVLSLTSNFRSNDFVSEDGKSDFLVHDSKFKRRLIIEVIPNAHQEFNLVKESKLLVVDWGNTKIREVGRGKSPKLHLNDEWLTFWSPSERTIYLKNLLTDKTYPIKLSSKLSPFFTPKIEMTGPESLVFTEVNDKGFAQINQYNLVTQKTFVMYKSSQTALRIDVCQHNGYLAFGEFPYDDALRGSSIMRIKLSGTLSLVGHETLYTSADPDVGNMVCTDKYIYFVKTMNNNRKLNIKTTEVVRMDLATTKVQVMTSLQSVNQIISMDGKVMAPFRGDFYVLEGEHNFSDDKLKPRNAPGSDEELEIEL